MKYLEIVLTTDLI